MVSNPSQTEEQTRYVPIDALKPHRERTEFPHDPEREDIEPVAEGEFRQNPKATPKSQFGDAEWTVMSGNRRIEEAGRHPWEEVKVDVVGPYDTADEELRALLDYNDYRSFTPVEKLNRIDAYRNLGFAVDEACRKHDMSTSTYDNGRWIRRAAEEGLWGLQNPKEMPDAAVEEACEQWRHLKHGEAAIGGPGRDGEPSSGAFGEIEVAIYRAEREASVADDPPVDTADSQQSSQTPDDFGDGEYGFAPVFGFNEGQVAKKRLEEERGKDVDAITTIGGRELSWWEKESIMPKHGYLLVNPVGFTTADPDRRDFRDLFRYEKGEQFVFSDSGGYQLMSMDDAEIVDKREDHSFHDLDVHPETLLEWQVNNADAGATIDFPPYNITGDAATPTVPEYPEAWERKFYNRMGKTAEMVERMSRKVQEMRKKDCVDASAFNFCPVLHGRPHPDADHPHEYVRQWHDAMFEASNVEPDGWVLKPEPRTPGQIAFWLGYAAEYLQDVEYLHVLMVGQPLTKALLMYYSMLTGQLVTSDTSSYAQGGESRQFYVPGTAGRRSTMIREGHEESLRLDEHPCKCQICTAVEREYGIEFLTEGNGAARSASMNLHNLHQQLEAGRWMKQQLQKEGQNVILPDGQVTGSEFWSVMRYHYGEQAEDLRRAMCYVRVAREDGLDAANEQYHIPWNGERGRTIERRDQAKPRPSDVLKPRTTMEGHHHIRDMSSVTGWD